MDLREVVVPSSGPVPSFACSFDLQMHTNICKFPHNCI